MVLSTYSLLDRDEALLSQVAWAGIVARRGAEHQEPRHPARPGPLRALTGGYRIALTGTPVENHLGDLWSLFEFLNPGLLGSREEFERRFAVPIQRYRDAEAAARLRRLVGPFILRRLKTDPAIIADLPDKLEIKVYCTLTREQAALYEAVVQETLERAARGRGHPAAGGWSWRRSPG